MCSKAVMVMVAAVMVMMVTPVHPRPHQAPKESDKIESAVSESLKQIETAIIVGARKIESAIEQTVQDKMLKESASKMEQQGEDSATAKASAKRNTALQHTLAKIFAARTKAGTVKGSAPVPASAKDGTADTTTTSSTSTTSSITTTTTTTMDPLDEYCKEACDAGLGGPECDCPEHPIG